MVNAHDPLESGCLLDQEAASARGSRRLRHRRLALAGQLLDIYRGVVERDDERSRDQQESKQQQAEERPRVVALREVEIDLHRLSLPSLNARILSPEGKYVGETPTRL